MHFYYFAYTQVEQLASSNTIKNKNSISTSSLKLIKRFNYLKYLLFLTKSNRTSSIFRMFCFCLHQTTVIFLLLYILVSIVAVRKFSKFCGSTIFTNEFHFSGVLLRDEGGYIWNEKRPKSLVHKKHGRQRIPRFWSNSVMLYERIGILLCGIWILSQLPTSYTC